MTISSATTTPSVITPHPATTSTTQGAGQAPGVPQSASVMVRVSDTGCEPVAGGPALAFLRADDLGILRGDGVFEALLALHGAPWHLEEHLTRLQRSAEMVDLDVPSIASWRAAVTAALAAWSRPGEATVRLVATRGPEEGGAPTTYVLVTPVSAAITRERREGITVQTLERGLVDHAPQRAPWLLLGAKTLSYAMNMAAKRWVHQHGVDDALFVSAPWLGRERTDMGRTPEGAVGEPPVGTSADAFDVGGGGLDPHGGASPGAAMVLEAPTAALVIARGNVLLSPPRSLGILPSITLDMLFANARAAGWDAHFAPLSLDDVHAADGAWLVSSIRLAARIRELDGRPLEGGALEAVIADLAATPPPPARHEHP